MGLGKVKSVCRIGGLALDQYGYLLFALFLKPYTARHLHSMLSRL